ncbi:MAG: hypothetical protein HY725_09395 [Candidatus Rokubacteria bacterium]|nr:hypothetical protein [Candidatus Rokubacteria bacterium]
MSLLLGIPLYCLGALVVQWLLNRVVRFLSTLGLYAAELPGRGIDWVARKLGGGPATGAAEKISAGVYLLTWKGPITLFSYLVIVGSQVGVIVTYTELFAAQWPGVGWVFGLLSLVWLWLSIGLWGLVLYWIVWLIFGLWLGLLGAFWGLVSETG